MTLTKEVPKAPGARPAAERAPRLEVSTIDSGRRPLDLGPPEQEPVSIWCAAHRSAMDSSRLAAPVFVSYASDDRQCFVEPLVEQLRGLGFTTWADWRDIATGDPWEAEIEKGLHTCCAMVAVLTPASVASDRWVRKEWTRALGHYFVPIVPVIVEDCCYPEILERFQYITAAPNHFAAGTALFRQADLRRLQEAIERLLLPRGRWIADQTLGIKRTFVGRGSELRDLVGRLDYGVLVGLARKAASSTVIVHGPGGIGKTMLVSELVRRIGPRYPGGVIFHSRGPRTDPQEVMRTWAAHVIGKAPAHISPEDLRSLLGAVGRLLVVIDDVWPEDYKNVDILCNQALPAGTERIVTTRHSNAKQAIGGKLFLLERLSQKDGVALLTDRLDEPGPVPARRTLRRLWKILGGHALALELAAGRCQDSPAFLDQQTDLLEREIKKGKLSRVAMKVSDPDRKRSVLVSFDLSLEELRETDRRFGSHLTERFAQLGVLAEDAPFDASTVAAIWDTEPADAVDSLLDLAKRALVIGIRGTKTFKLHPLLHAYTLGLLEELPKLLESARAHHLHHYTDRVRQFREKSWSELEDHAANISLAGDRAAAGLPEEVVREASRPEWSRKGDELDRDAASRVMELALAAAHYVWLRRVHAGRRWLEAGLAGARLLRNPLAEARLLTHLGVWHNERGARDEALRYFNRALPIWRRRRRAHPEEGGSGLAWVLNNLGVLHRAIDEPRKADNFYRQAIRIQEQLGDRKGLSIALGCRGVLCRDRGQHRKAHGYYDRSLALEEELGSELGQSIVLNNKGRAYRDERKRTEALESLKRALKLAKKAGNDAGEAIVLNNLGNVFFDDGQVKKALSYFRKAVPIREKILDRARLAVSYHNIGEALRALGRRDEALESFERAIAVEERVADFAGRAATLYALAALLLEIGTPESRSEALSRLEAAREALEKKDLQLTAAGVALARIRELKVDWQASRWTPPDPAPTI